MRLICPNCAAQYEVDAALIPDGGRDVQCSSCGHTWFQPEPAGRSGAALSLSPETAWRDEFDEAEDDGEPLPPPPPTRRRIDAAAMAILREEAAREAAERQREAAALETQGDLGLSEAGAPDRRRAEPPARAEDLPAAPPPVAEEAGDAASPIPQEDAALAEIEAPEAPWAEPVAGPRPATPEWDEVPGEEPAEEEPLAFGKGPAWAPAEDEDEAEEAPAPADQWNGEAAEIPWFDDAAAAPAEDEDEDEEPEASEPGRPDDETLARAAAAGAARRAATSGGSRRDLLPDIEEINSTLSAAPGRDAVYEIDEEEEDERRRAGFRLGFSAVITVTAVALLAYAFAPQIAARFPASEPALAAYVGWMNGLRDALDALLQKAGSALGAD